MNKINELSPELATKAAEKASTRFDDRGDALHNKFYNYAINKNQNLITFITYDDIKHTIIPTGETPLRKGNFLFIKTKIVGDRIRSLQITICLNTFPVHSVYIKYSGEDNGKLIKGFDRKSAVVLSKITGIPPTKFPLLDNKPKINKENISIMKENYEVTEFSLKKIVENLDKIPRDGGAKFGDEIPKLTPQQKKNLMEKVSKFNEYGKVLRCETAIMEMAKTLSEISQLAESYALTESGDYFHAEVVKRDFKEVKNTTKDFSNLSKECYSKLQQLNALFENLGQKYQRYFEIKSLDEIYSNNSQLPPTNEIVGDEVSSSIPQEDHDHQGKFTTGDRNLGIN